MIEENVVVNFVYMTTYKAKNNKNRILSFSDSVITAYNVLFSNTDFVTKIYNHHYYILYYFLNLFNLTRKFFLNQKN